MNSLLKLTRIEFDSSENRDPIYISEEKYFQDEPPLSAHCVCEKYVNSLRISTYLGYDGNVYPQFKSEKIYINN